jgi:hypothetical protein
MPKPPVGRMTTNGAPRPHEAGPDYRIDIFQQMPLCSYPIQSKTSCRATLQSFFLYPATAAGEFRRVGTNGRVAPSFAPLRRVGYANLSLRRPTAADETETGFVL